MGLPLAIVQVVALFVAYLAFVVVLVGGFVVWIWALLDCLNHAPQELKIRRLRMILFLHIVGAFWYLRVRDDNVPRQRAYDDSGAGSIQK